MKYPLSIYFDIEIGKWQPAEENPAGEEP